MKYHCLGYIAKVFGTLAICFQILLKLRRFKQNKKSKRLQIKNKYYLAKKYTQKLYIYKKNITFVEK